MALESREVSKKLRNYNEASDDDIDHLINSDNNGRMSTDGSSDLSDNSSGCGSSFSDLDGDSDKKKKKRRKQHSNNPKLNYKCIGYWKENHGHPIFGVSVNHHLGENDPTVFATVGYNRVTVYEAMDDSIKLLQCYSDSDTDENFYTCAWSYDSDTGRPILAAGGCKGIIRLFSPARMNCIRFVIDIKLCLDHYLKHLNTKLYLKDQISRLFTRIVE